MKINEVGLELIKGFEGCKLKAYKDIVGVWTIGYGCTEGVYPGMTMTHEQEMLMKELAQFEHGVSACVKVPLNENQFSALVSFAYNLGLGSLQKSTLLKKLNGFMYEEAADEFPRWSKAGGKVIPGLLRRRMAEYDLFNQAP